MNDVQITKHQVRQSTDGDISDETWTDIPNSAYGGVNATSLHHREPDGRHGIHLPGARGERMHRERMGCENSGAATATMATPDADALAQPTGLMATAGNTQITLTWTNPDDAAILNYEYQQKEGSAAFGNWTDIPDSGATTTSFRW